MPANNAERRTAHIASNRPIANGMRIANTAMLVSRIDPPAEPARLGAFDGIELPTYAVVVVVGGGTTVVDGGGGTVVEGNGEVVGGGGAVVGGDVGGGGNVGGGGT